MIENVSLLLASLTFLFFIYHLWRSHQSENTLHDAVKLIIERHGEVSYSHWHIYRFSSGKINVFQLDLCGDLIYNSENQFDEKDMDEAISYFCRSCGLTK